MIPGFKLRIIQEMKYLIENYKEFKQLDSIKDLLKIPDNLFPPNCMQWVGASLVASLNSEIDRFMTNCDEFQSNGDKINDRFGEAFLFATRDEPYLNPDFEYRNQFAKHAIYTSGTPQSAQTKDKQMNIDQELEKKMLGMVTPTGSMLGGMSPASSIKKFNFDK